MRLLLDTHVLIAVVEERTAALPAGIRQRVEGPDDEFHVSVASLWEVAIKHRLGKLRLSTALAALPDLIEAMGAELLVVTAAHALTAVEPEPATRDPFDRMLLAQCQIEGLRLLTRDQALIDHPLAAPSSIPTT
jgi:PIN domain nuclease of toxin-antitoxin system